MNRRARQTAILLIALLLGGCAAAGGDYAGYLARKRVTNLMPERFDHCRGYGCRFVVPVTFSAQDWADLARLMPPAADAGAERTQIAQAIGMMERKTGAYTGTAEDVGGTYVKIGDFQHDCVDESVNTTVYLSVLKARGLIRFHDIGVPQARIPPFSRGLGPHQTAVVIDAGTGDAFAVDSWFHDNGRPAEIVPLKDWFFGWRPDKKANAPEQES